MVFGSSPLSWNWNLNFFRDITEREIEEFSYLLAVLGNVFIDEMSIDRRVWKTESSGTFTCRSHFNWLRDDYSFSNCSPANFIWKANVPCKVQLFAWVLSNDQINKAKII